MSIENAVLPRVGRAIAFARYGGPEVLQLAERPVPAPGAGELLVRVAAASVNPGDVWLRAGRFRRFFRLALPFVPGSDLAGTVEAVGRNVTRFAEGERVYAMQPLRNGGGYADFALVQAAHAARTPRGPLEVAAALPLVGLTALQALRRASVQTDTRLLVYGAAGGVGHLAVQIGRALGARVTGAASGRHAAFVRDLGASHFVDRTQPDWTAGLGGFDVVFDAVGLLPNRLVQRLTRPGGVFVTVQPLAERLSPDWLAWTRGGRRVRSLLVQPDGDGLRFLADLVNAGRLRPEIEASFPLEEAVQAQQRLMQGQARGKLVLIAQADLAREDGWA